MTTHEVRSKIAAEIRMWRTAQRLYGEGEETWALVSVHTLRAFGLLFPKERYTETDYGLVADDGWVEALDPPRTQAELNAVKAAHAKRAK